jgi:TonB family protein
VSLAQTAKRPFCGSETNIAYGNQSTEQKAEYFAGNLGELPALVFTNAPPVLRQELKTVTESNDVDLSDDEDPSGDSIWLPARRFTDEEYASMQAITSLSVSRYTKNNVILDTGKFKAPMQALDACVDELVTGWGIDAEKHKSLSRPATPKSNPGRWIKSSEYPQELLRKGKQAIVNFRLIVDEKGETETCDIQQSTRPVEFDEAVCRALMLRAKFEPALDDKGEAIKSYFINSVTFQI